MGIPFQWHSLGPELPGVTLSKAAGPGLWSWPIFLSQGEGAITALLTVSCLESSPGRSRGGWPTRQQGVRQAGLGRRHPAHLSSQRICE